MRRQGLGALPGFDHRERVRPEFRLKRTDARGVDMRRIFDASLLRPDRRDIGAKRG